MSLPFSFSVVFFQVFLPVKIEQDLPESNMWCALGHYIFNQSVFTFVEVSIACTLVLATSRGMNHNQGMCNISFSHFSFLPCCSVFTYCPGSWQLTLPLTLPAVAKSNRGERLAKSCCSFLFLLFLCFYFFFFFSSTPWVEGTIRIEVCVWLTDDHEQCFDCAQKENQIKLVLTGIISISKASTVTAKPFLKFDFSIKFEIIVFFLMRNSNEWPHLHSSSKPAVSKGILHRPPSQFKKTD